MHMEEMDVYSDWTTTFFRGLAVEFWDAIAPQPTEQEIKFLRDVFGGARELLDVACGAGRFAIPLTAVGYRVSGIDLSEQALALARDRAPHIDWHHGDIRQMTWNARFDGALCFGNSFGYFPREETRAFLRTLRRALKPGASFVMETGALAESLLPALQPSREHAIGEIRCTSIARYDATASRLDVDYTFRKGDRSESAAASTWVFTAAEVGEMLNDAGFGDVSFYASASREPFVLNIPRAVVVTRNCFS